MQQMTIYDFLPDPNVTLEVDVRGIMDDAYCPRCGDMIPDKCIDATKCPECGQKITWGLWHRLNPEYQNGKWNFIKND